MMSSSSCSQLGIISKNNPPPRTKLAVQHAYEFALQGLQSLVKTNFKCSKCSQTLHDTHLVSAGSCVHRYCGTCVNIHERRERARSRYEGDDSSHMPSLKKDPSFDQVVVAALEAIKHLQKYDASIKEDGMNAAHGLVNFNALPRSSDGYNDSVHETSDNRCGTNKSSFTHENLQAAGASWRKSSMREGKNKRKLPGDVQDTDPWPRTKKPRVQGAAADLVERSLKRLETLNTNHRTFTQPIPPSNKKRQNKSFEERFNELTSFKQVHGHCDVPRSHPTLGMWCNHVRMRYKQGIRDDKNVQGSSGSIILTPDRIEMLENIGFGWYKNKTFDERLEDLAQFKETEGHCEVPNDHPTLGTWFKGVKKNYKLLMNGKPQTSGTTLTLERIKRLEAVGVFWFTTKKTFEQRIEELVEFKRCYGHFRVPYKHPSLGVWCHNARQSHKRLMIGKSQQCGMRMTPERIERLDAIGFFD